MTACRNKQDHIIKIPTQSLFLCCSVSVSLFYSTHTPSCPPNLSPSEILLLFEFLPHRCTHTESGGGGGGGVGHTCDARARSQGLRLEGEGGQGG